MLVEKGDWNIMENLWKRVDDYLNNQCIKSDLLMESILQSNKEAGLPSIDVSPSQGKFLYLLVKMIQAKYFLDIGTLGGYSTVWMARALPEDGYLFTLESNETHAKVARKNIFQAGFEDQVEVIVGKAIDALPTLNHTFDLAFFDADKENNPKYLEWALKLSKQGTVIVADNVVRDGKILYNESDDPRIHGLRTFFDMIAKEERIEATFMQTVGEKGYDGFLIGRIKS